MNTAILVASAAALAVCAFRDRNNAKRTNPLVSMILTSMFFIGCSTGNAKYQKAVANMADKGWDAYSGSGTNKLSIVTNTLAKKHQSFDVTVGTNGHWRVVTK